MIEKIHVVERDDRRWWPIVVSVGTSALSAVLAAALCLTVQARNAERGREARLELTRQVCSLVIAFDDNYRADPPQTELGKRNATDIAALRVTLGCAAAS